MVEKKKRAEVLHKEISAMRLQIAEMKAKIENLSSLIEVSSVISSTLDLMSLLTIIMEISKSVMKAEASSLMLVDEQTNELVYKVALGEKGSEVKEKFRLKMGQGIAGWVAQKGKPLLVPDVEKEPRFYRKPDEETGLRRGRYYVCRLRPRSERSGFLKQ